MSGQKERVELAAGCWLDPVTGRLVCTEPEAVELVDRLKDRFIGQPLCREVIDKMRLFAEGYELGRRATRGEA